MMRCGPSSPAVLQPNELLPCCPPHLQQYREIRKVYHYDYVSAFWQHPAETVGWGCVDMRWAGRLHCAVCPEAVE